MSDETSIPDKLQCAIEAEAKRVEEDSLYNYAGHNEEARIADRQHRWLGIPATLIAAAAGVTSFSTASAGSGVGSWPSIVAGILSFGVAALSGLTTFLDPKARALEHYRAANLYAKLQSDARYFHEIECRKGKRADELDRVLVELMERLTKLDEQTPIIPSSSMAKARKQIEAGKYRYKIDE
jgi:hypothetical protein